MKYATALDTLPDWARIPDELKEPVSEIETNLMREELAKIGDKPVHEWLDELDQCVSERDQQEKQDTHKLIKAVTEVQEEARKILEAHLQGEPGLQEMFNVYTYAKEWEVASRYLPHLLKGREKGIRYIQKFYSKARAKVKREGAK
ncbi:MAG TPA: hypothetical protein VGK00_03245 [Anaerolineales bacterium]|jgi:hypothetical protein